MQYDSEFGKDKFEVAVTEDKQHFKCSCRKLDRDGIPCCHVLKITERLDLLVVPESFVRYRWIKQADQEIELQVVQELILRGCNAANPVQYCLMMGKFHTIVQAFQGTKRVELFIAEFQKLKDTINSKLKQPHDSNGEQITSTNAEGTCSTTYKNPPILEQRGKRKRRVYIAEKIEKDAIAKAKKKAAQKNSTNRCTKCKSTLHDKKSCTEIEKKPHLPQVQHSAYFIFILVRTNCWHKSLLPQVLQSQGQ